MISRAGDATVPAVVAVAAPLFAVSRALRAQPSSMDVRKIAALLLLLLLGVFVAMNLDTARVWCFGVRAEMPIALVVVLSGLLGIAAGWLLAFVRRPAQKHVVPPPAK